MNYINVSDYKEVYADGIHDDTRALQECIDKLREGGTVYFPDGIYLVSSTLIFYSNQHLKLSENAVILRSAGSTPLTRYLLASYSEPEWNGYDGTHDVVISGGVFDGNEKLTEKSTLINTVHCKNIRIENSRFLHCSQWHFIELNSTENAVVEGCIFEGGSYTAMHEELLNELIQLDRARDGSYGPVYRFDGALIDFCKDGTPCRGISIKNNIFRCAGFPAIGHHDDCAHRDIEIIGNIFDGPSGRIGKSRGYIIFRPQTCDVRVTDNKFTAPEVSDSPNYGIIIESSDKTALFHSGNTYSGSFDKLIIQGDFNID